MDFYDPKHKQRVSKTLKTKAITTVEKKMVLLSDVLHKHKAPPVIDYLSLDTEGSELAILEVFPFDQFGFRLMTVEHNNYKGVLDALKKLLLPHGYVCVKNVHGDGYFVNKELMKGIV